MEASGRVIVVGSSNTDLVVHAPRLPMPGETVLGDDLHIYAGGKGANQAVAAARAGAAVLFIGAFGQDDFGEARKADLERDGIDCRGCALKAKRPSGVAFIAISSSPGKTKAENQILVAPGANAALTARDVKSGLPSDLNQKDIVLCSLEVPLSAIKAAFITAQKAGARTILNPAPFPGEGLPSEILKRCNVLTPNQIECESLLKAFKKKRSRPEDEFLPMKQFLSSQSSAKNQPQCIVTQGAQGAAWFRISTDLSSQRQQTLISMDYPAPKVRPVDTVGAGDCFNGCLAAALSQWPHNLERAIRFAIQGAAISVTRAGAQPGMPTQEEITQHYSKQ